MKKNDFATFLVYIGMFAIAILVGLLLVAPAVSASGLTTGLAVAVVLTSVVVGVIWHALALELLHLLGALAGGYSIVSWNVLGVRFAKENGKLKVKPAAFDGLTGQTKILPKDVNVSSPGAMILFPMLGYLIEVVVCCVFAVIFKGQWVEIAMEVLLAIGGMIFLYNDFPAHLDSVTDGYLLTLMTKSVNRVAYNQILLAENANSNGQKLETPVYDEISDFTARLNMISVYRYLDEGNFQKAIEILDKTINAESGPSASTVEEAASMKLSSLFFFRDLEPAKKLYEEMSDAQKKYIAAIPTMSALRCYLLISGLIDESEAESNFALDKAMKLIKKCAENEAPVERKLLDLSFARVSEAHPGWELMGNYLPEEEPKKK